MAKSFRIRVSNAPIQQPAFALQARDGAYLSPHGRLATWSSAAAFRRGDQADACISLWLNALQKRWGKQITLEVEETQDGSANEVSIDGAATLLARGQCQCFASNQPIADDLVIAAKQVLEREH